MRCSVQHAVVWQEHVVVVGPSYAIPATRGQEDVRQTSAKDIGAAEHPAVRCTSAKNRVFVFVRWQQQRYGGSGLARSSSTSSVIHVIAIEQGERKGKRYGEGTGSRARSSRSHWSRTRTRTTFKQQ